MALQEQIGGVVELEFELEAVVVVAAADGGDKGAAPPAVVVEVVGDDSVIRRASIPPIKSATLGKPSLTKDDANYAR